MSGPPVLRTVAPAKINWTLEVLGKRDDGYHEIRSVMQTLRLVDDVCAFSASSLAVHFDGPEAARLDPLDNSLAAAARSFPASLSAHPLSFSVYKRIPAAAGLGGGSSDAAAALWLMRQAWNAPEDRAWSATAAALGSDVSFFLHGGTRWVAGRGDEVAPLGNNGICAIMLMRPPIDVANKTRRLYAEIEPRHYSDGRATALLRRKLSAGGRVSPDDYVNVFDQVADRVFPGLQEYRRMLEDATGTRALLAGAGPTLFAVLASERLDLSHAAEHMQAAEGALRRRGVWAHATTTLSARGLRRLRSADALL